MCSACDRRACNQVALGVATGVPLAAVQERVDAPSSRARTRDALLVPSAALVRDGTGWRVFLVDGGKAPARAVTLNDRNADQASGSSKG